MFPRTLPFLLLACACSMALQQQGPQKAPTESRLVNQLPPKTAVEGIPRRNVISLAVMAAATVTHPAVASASDYSQNDIICFAYFFLIGYYLPQFMRNMIEDGATRAIQTENTELKGELVRLSHELKNEKKYKNLELESELKKMNKQLGSEVKEMNSQFKDDMKDLNKQLFNELSTQVRGEIEEINSRVKDEIKEMNSQLQGEMERMNSQLKDEMKETTSHHRGDIKELSTKIDLLAVDVAASFDNQHRKIHNFEERVSLQLEKLDRNKTDH